MHACYVKTGLKKYVFYASKLTSFVKEWQHTDGDISIAPNQHESERCGWDGYMFSIVCNAYAALMLLLTSEIIKKYLDVGTMDLEKSIANVET